MASFSHHPSPLARSHSPAGESRARVTAREAEVLDHLCRGLTDREIARALGLQSSTVKNHLHHIYGKIAVRSRTEAVLKWLGGAAR